MEPAALHHPSRQPTDAVSLETEFFFDALRCEHERVLAAVRRAGSHLSVSPGTLAEYSATHARLLQRFLDAQRGLLRRRAESDRVAAVIRTEAEESARSTLAAAHAEAVARMMRRALVAAHGGVDTHPVLDDWDRLDATNEALGPMSGYLDVAGFNRIIDDELPQPSVAADEMYRELSRLLEQWWEAEQRGAAEQADHATSRAALLERLVTIEANEIVDAVGPMPTEAELALDQAGTPPALPQDLLAMFDQADALDDLLAGCVALLGGEVQRHDTAVEGDEATATVQAVAEERARVVPEVEPLLRFADFSAEWPSPIPEVATAPGITSSTGTTSVVDRPQPIQAPAVVDVEARDDESDEDAASIGRQAAAVAMRVIAPMAAFSLVFALLAWLVG